MSELQAKHLVGSEGVAGVPTNRLLLVFDSSTVPFLFALEVYSPLCFNPSIYISIPTGYRTCQFDNDSATTSS
jgi:hypothetical protein